MEPGKWVSASRRLLGVALLVALASVSSQAAAVETVKIFRSTMPDGSVVLGDKPSGGARSVTSETIVLTAPRGAAEAERDYWRRQAEAFNLRQQRREAGTSYRRAAHPGTVRYDEEDSLQPSVVYYAPPAGKPLVPPGRVARDYTSSPGAARGRSSGFIGSGFSTAR